LLDSVLENTAAPRVAVVKQLHLPHFYVLLFGQGWTQTIDIPRVAMTMWQEKGMLPRNGQRRQQRDEGGSSLTKAKLQNTL
jgi:hypothetical protein